MKVNITHQFQRDDTLKPNNLEPYPKIKNHPFHISSIQKDFALLPGIGRFCALPGCYSPIMGKKITYIHPATKKQRTYFLKPDPNQKYCCNKHARKSQNKNRKRNIINFKKEGIPANLDFQIHYDQDMQPFRILKICLTSFNQKANTIEIKISPKENKNIWAVVEKVIKYTTEPMITNIVRGH